MNYDKMREALRHSFMEMGAQFLAAAQELWSDDAAALRVLDTWAGQLAAAVAGAGDSETRRAALFDAIVCNFHELFKDSYTAIAARDTEAMFGTADKPREPNAWTAALGVARLLHAAHADDVATCWEYTQILARHANMYAMYKRCPKSLLTHIHRMAETLHASMASGTATAADINPLALGRQLMTQLRPEELSAFGASILEDGALDGIVAMLQGMIGMLHDGGGGGASGGASGMAAMNPAEMMAAMAAEASATT